MRKEVLIIFLLGIGLGSIIAYGAWRANSALNQKPYATSFTGPTPTIPVNNIVSQEKLGLTIAQPDNFAISVNDVMPVSGISSTGPIIIISGEDDDYLINTNAQGDFTQDVVLVSGVNQILISATKPDGNKVDKILTLVYSPEFSKSLETDSTEPDTSEGKNSLDEKVQDKLNLAKNSPKAILGTITDKTNGTLQLKNTEGGIQQVSVTELTTFAKTGSSSTNIKYDDLAIGDFVVAMGIAGSNGVFNSLRVLVTTPTETTSRQIVTGTVNEIVKKTITITTYNGSDTTLTFPSKWDGPEIKEFEAGQKVFAVLVKDDKLGSIVRTIDFLESPTSSN